MKKTFDNYLIEAQLNPKKTLLSEIDIIEATIQEIKEHIKSFPITKDSTYVGDMSLYLKEISEKLADLNLYKDEF